MRKAVLSTALARHRRLPPRGSGLALIARKEAKLSLGSLRTYEIVAHNSVVSRLAPSCTAVPLLGDSVPGGVVEVQLRCKAYNGDVGIDTVLTKTPGSTAYDFTRASNAATRNTSRAVSQA